MKSAIITCAPTGAIHTPSMSRHLPVTPEEIAADAIGAAESGAAVVHLHVRTREDGRPIQDVGLFTELLDIVRSQSDVIVNLTTGGSPQMSVEERIQPALALAPELASLNMGSMNFGLFPMLDRFSELEHDWERTHLGNKAIIFRNTYEDIERILKDCGDQGTRFEFECYDTSHLYNLAHFLDRGLVEPPLFIQSVVGLLGGTGAHIEDLVHMKRTAERLFGDQYEFSALGAGSSQIRTAAVSLAMGGNARVGLEDSLWDGPGKLAEASSHQVDRVATIATSLHRQVATSAEARTRLRLRDA